MPFLLFQAPYIFTKCLTDLLFNYSKTNKRERISQKTIQIKGYKKITVGFQIF